MRDIILLNICNIESKKKNKPPSTHTVPMGKMNSLLWNLTIRYIIEPLMGHGMPRLPVPKLHLSELVPSPEVCSPHQVPT